VVRFRIPSIAAELARLVVESDRHDRVRQGPVRVEPVRTLSRLGCGTSSPPAFRAVRCRPRAAKSGRDTRVQDIRRVEVLHGAAAVRYGGNAASGVILIYARWVEMWAR